MSSEKLHNGGLPQFSTLAPFDYQPRTRLIFGANRLAEVGELTAQLPASKVLLVTDPGIVAAGHSERARRFLESAGLKVTVFDQSEENPTTRCVEACLQLAKSAGIDAFVAIGGGSSLDTAKGCNF